MGDLKPTLAKLAAGETLGTQEATDAFDVLMSGEATPSQIGGMLLAMRVRGETVEEITGAARTMRDKMLRVDAPKNAIDIVGTGGDASGTYNISTCTALVVAAAGVPVAKHGNRALSSKSGAADVLMALGVDIEIGPDRIAECIRNAGVGFMFAPSHHAAMKHVGPTRVELGTRTIFNLLGPLSNPAGTRRQLLGVFAAEWVEPLAHVMHNLGAEKVWVVHGTDGLDEMTVTGATLVAELDGGSVRTFEVSPEDAGLSRAMPTELKGGDAAHNAKALREVLAGADGAYRDIVLLNAAAGLVIADKASDLKEGAGIAAEMIDSGRAAETLKKLVAVSKATHG
ncbi:MAG: anthranilate phosphoribosyltransferase [Rhodobiaceae bacterium]|nr:anthranilate phosphoribosyltransferase [Rhodobiaceae bacterium]MCC0057514.1 anthranilate phosphoribosyltransferase [Rhodobiaceae bacterium]